MINNLYENILNNVDIRQSLSALRQDIKEASAKSRLQKLVAENPDHITNLLGNEDAKSRKNAALLMGDLELSAFYEPLFAGYEAESTLFVKSAYLEALSHFDCSDHLGWLRKHLEILTSMEIPPENKKHIDAQIRELSRILIAIEGPQKHTFSGFRQKFHCILLTNRLHKDITEDQITDGTLQDFHAGVMVTTENIEELLSIRTYSELLLVIPGTTTCPRDPRAAAQAIADSKLLDLLKNSHREPAPFYFRINVKGKLPLSAKSDFTKKLSSELERQTNRELLNTTSHYELELRLIENKKGTFNLLIKLNTLPDDRFAYRKASVAASMKPVNAALLVELARDYMIPDAQILDPFCGVATLLIERQMVVKGNTSYGIDAFPEAIERAKINTEAAGQIIHFVNKSCFQFTHDYLFDEIFTDMPFETGHKSDDEIYEIYE
ncbi:MAG: hypothetical protein PHN80_12855, partial [Hespellia sp.]|nr:hypothetical protein [Hespellia sp.]